MAAAPQAVSFSPVSGSTLGSVGLTYDVNVTFDRDVRLPVGWEKGRSTALLTCELDDALFIPLNAPRGTKIRQEIPRVFQALPDNQTLQFQIGRLAFHSRYGCVIKIGEGVVVGRESGAANVGAEYEVVISDNVPPMTKLSGWNVPLHTKVLVISFVESVFFTGLAPSLHRIVMNKGIHYEKLADIDLVQVTGDNRLDLELTLPFELLQDSALYSVALEKGSVQDRNGNPMAAFDVGTYTFRAVIRDGITAQASTTLNAAGVASIVVGACVFLGLLVFSSWVVYRCKATLHDKATATTQATCEVSDQKLGMEEVGSTESLPQVHGHCEAALSEMPPTEADIQDHKVAGLPDSASDNVWPQKNIRNAACVDLPGCISSREPSPSVSLRGSSKNSSKHSHDRQQMAGVSAQRPGMAHVKSSRSPSPNVCMNDATLPPSVQGLESTCGLPRNGGSRQPSRHRSLPPSGRSTEVDTKALQRRATIGGVPVGTLPPRIQDLGKSKHLPPGRRWRDSSPGQRRREASQASSRESSSVGSARSLHLQ